MSRTFYEGHDRVYQTKHRSGDYGWTSAAESTENFERITTHLPPGLTAFSRILDLGCGSGELTLHYAKISPHVTGIDIAPTAITWARERLPHLQFYQGSVLDPAILPEEHFDLVIDSNCLHCIIGRDRSLLLSNVQRWLKPGGHLLLHTMCGEPVGELLEGYDPGSRLIYRGEFAIRYLGKAGDIIEEIEAAGFQYQRHHVFPQSEGPDMLVSLHRKPSSGS